MATMDINYYLAEATEVNAQNNVGHWDSISLEALEHDNLLQFWMFFCEIHCSTPSIAVLQANLFFVKVTNHWKLLYCGGMLVAFPSLSAHGVA
jgi:hypothetical protein